MTTREGQLPLAGRVALVTGVSRPAGIGFALAERMADLGATVFASGWPLHDDEMPWGGAALPDRSSLRYDVERRDLGLAHEPAALIDAVVERHDVIDIVLAVHARSSSGSLAEVTADELDRCWAVNVRSIVLLAQRFAAVRGAPRPGGRLIWFTSGQHIEPMPGALAYSVSKGALHQMTASIAESLASIGIVVNCINPGPVDTGWARHPDTPRDLIERAFPSGRWGQPSDVANLVEFLVRDEGEWIQGQVINSEGGFRRWARSGWN